MLCASAAFAALALLTVRPVVAEAVLFAAAGVPDMEVSTVKPVEPPVAVGNLCCA